MHYIVVETIVNNFLAEIPAMAKGNLMDFPSRLPGF